MSRVAIQTKPIQRTPRANDEPHLDFIRALSCVVCMRPSGADGLRTEAAHIRFNDSRYLKTVGGREKPNDKWTVPLCHRHHAEQTKIGEGPQYWEGLGMDPHAFAMVLHSVSPDIETGERVVKNWNGWLR